MSRVRVLAYARFQLGDYLLHRASIPLVLVLIAAGLPLYAAMRSQPGSFASPEGAAMAHTLFTKAVALFLPVGAFLGGTGVISGDRQQGTYRFLFSRPVDVLAYYAQAYAIHGLAFVALFGLLTALFSALTVPQPVWGAMAAAALTFVLVGGLGFLCGVVTRFDGAMLAVIYLFSSGIQQMVEVLGAAPLPQLLKQIARFLPPVGRLDQLREQLYAHAAVDWMSCAHVLAYGLGSFALGLVLLRKLPLVR